MSDRVDQQLLDRIGLALKPGARVLDLPAGNGGLSRKLGEAGIRITALDRFPESFRWDGTRPVCADMNVTLPFAAATFEGVVCQEGIEHLENPALFLRECARVLAPGGHIWLTTPNFMDLSSRLSFLLTGMKSFSAGFPNEETTVWGRDGESIYHGHAFTLPFFQIRYLLRTGGFTDVDLAGTGRSGTSALLYPLIRPFVGPFVRRAWKRRSHKATPSAALLSELNSTALGKPLLLSKKILIQAKRE